MKNLGLKCKKCKSHLQYKPLLVNENHVKEGQVINCSSCGSMFFIGLTSEGMRYLKSKI